VAGIKYLKDNIYS